MKTMHTLGIAAALALTALTSQAANYEIPHGDESWPPVVHSTSTLTRAQVLAELQDARQNHRMAVTDGDQVQLRADELTTTSSISREAVRAEAAAALKSGNIAFGEW